MFPVYKFKTLNFNKATITKPPIENLPPIFTYIYDILYHEGNLYLGIVTNDTTEALCVYNLASKVWTNHKIQSNLDGLQYSNITLLNWNSQLLVYGRVSLLCDRVYTGFLHRNGCQFELTAERQMHDMAFDQAAIMTDTYMYAVGGTKGLKFNCDVDRYDIRLKKWQPIYVSSEKIRKEPPGLCLHKIALHNERIFVFGGGTYITTYGLNVIPVFNIVSCRWEHENSVHDHKYGYPSPRKSHAAVQLNYEVFISGGTNGVTYFDDVWKFNLENLRWTKLQCKLPQPLAFHCAAISADSKMFVSGGRTMTNGVVVPVICELYEVWLNVPKLSAMCWEALTQYLGSLGVCDRDDLIRAGVPLGFVRQVYWEM